MVRLAAAFAPIALLAGPNPSPEIPNGQGHVIGASLDQTPALVQGDILNVFREYSVGGITEPTPAGITLSSADLSEKAALFTEPEAPSILSDAEVAPDGAILISGSQSLSLDPSTLQLTPLLGISIPQIFEIHPNGKIYGIRSSAAGDSIVEIDRSSHAERPVVLGTFSEFDIQGDLLVISDEGVSSVEISTGNKTLISDLAVIKAHGLPIVAVVGGKNGVIYVGADGCTFNDSSCPFGDFSIWKLDRSGADPEAIGIFGSTTVSFFFLGGELVDLEEDPTTEELVMSAIPRFSCVNLCGGGGFQLIRFDPITRLATYGPEANRAIRGTNGIAVIPSSTDSDADGIADAFDNCRNVSNPNQEDTDRDGTGDACNDEMDPDGDEISDALDNCDTTSNSSQADTDHDGVGDACNDAEDLDGDEFADALDNCPSVTNASQTDRDLDLYGDACDHCPDYRSANNNDFDHNGIGDECECGDQSLDSTVNIIDIIAMNGAIYGSGRVSPLCDTNFDGNCDVRDMVGVSRKIFGRPAYCSRYPPPGP